MNLLGLAGESFQSTGTYRRTIILSVVLFPWPPSPLVSALCLPHLITTHCLTTVREGIHEEHHSLICLTYLPTCSVSCVFVRVCAHMGDNESVKTEKRKETGWRSLIAQHTWHEVWVEDAGWWGEGHSRHLARIHKHINALIPGLCPSLSFKWCYALILTLWLNQSPHLSCFFFLFLFFSLMSLLHSVSRPLSLAPSSSL